MKTGRSISELAQEIQRQTETKRDFIAPGKSQALTFKAEQGFKFELAGQDDFDTEQNFHSQLGESLGIPKPYYERLRQEAPDLLVKNVNHWLPSQPKRMIRTLDGKARAYLSDRYRPLDHFDLMDAILPQIMKTECIVESCEVTPSRLYLKAVSPRITGEVNVGDFVQAGVMVSNSEIGLGSLTVQPLLFRLVCRNGAIVNDLAFRKTHVGRNGYGELTQAVQFFRDDTKQASDRAFFLQVRDTVAAVLTPERFQPLVDKMRRAFENPFAATDVEPIVEEVTKRWTLHDGERKSVMAHLIAGGDLSQYGMMNALTRTAQDVQDYDRATELEIAGGDVLQLTNGAWRKLVEASIANKN